MARKKLVSVRLDEADHKKLEELAEQTHLSVSWLIQEAVRYMLKVREDNRGKAWTGK